MRKGAYLTLGKTSALLELRGFCDTWRGSGDNVDQKDFELIFFWNFKRRGLCIACGVAALGVEKAVHSGKAMRTRK